MQFRYPRSFFKLLGVGFVLAVLPLIVGLVANTLTIQHLAAQSQQAVFNAAQIAHGSRQLAEIIPGLERAARQSLILEDESLRQGYAALRQEFNVIVLRMVGMPLDADIRALLMQMADQEMATFAAHQARPAKPAQLGGLFRQLGDSGRELLERSNTLIGREAAALKARAVEAHANTRTQLLIVIPAALLVVAGFTYLLARPIAQIEAGIHALGEQRLHDRIVVEGPDDLVKLGQRLDWLRQRLRLFEEQKAQFMRHVAHELKTPLTALREGSDLLAEGTAGAMPPRQQEIVGIVRDNSIHLQHLIEDLLRHGEAEFRAEHVVSAPLSLPELMQQLAAKHGIALQARQLELQRRVDDVTIRTDPERLRVIVDNLLSNAIKHAPAGSRIELHAHLADGELLLRVMDAGPGVAEAERAQIFEPFFRGSTPGDSKIKSTGLGLSICRDHVLALNGSITVGSGCGDFQVRLPVVREGRTV